MNDIKIKQKQSLLQEVLNEAFGSLSDEALNNLIITEVICSKGNQSAIVYIQGNDINSQQRQILLSKLHKAKGFIKECVTSSTGWFKCPNLIFKFDDSLEQANNLDAIFAKIAQEKKG